MPPDLSVDRIVLPTRVTAPCPRHIEVVVRNIGSDPAPYPVEVCLSFDDDRSDRAGGGRAGDHLHRRAPGTVDGMREDGSTVDFRLPPRRTPVQATLTLAGLDALPARPAEVDLGFWGRGAAATWRRLNKASEAHSNNVDLSKLTAIHLALRSRSFIA